MRSGLIVKLKDLQPFQTTTGDMPEETLRAILRQADIDTDEFLKMK